MKKQTCIWTIALLVLANTACKRENDNNPALHGKWQGVEWLASGKSLGQDAAQVMFEFQADGNYSAGFGDQQERGTWRTVKEKLYTQATGKQEIVVRILQLNDNTLKFEMNRGGRQETIELKKLQ
ncbi:MAG: lipocalin family protein [Saprospiraceae bacterium]|nr:lipocalin family protein [Lewinellaceae bacterium]